MNQRSLLFFAIVALLAWILNFHFIRIRAWETRPRVEMVMGSWLSILCLALAVTFQILAFSSNLQFHLLFWFFAYVTFSLALYFSALFTAYQSYDIWRRLATVVLLVDLTTLSYLYIFHLSEITWTPDHNIPNSLAEYLYLMTLFLYSVMMGGVPILQHVKDYFRETAIPTQTRYIALIIARVSGIAYFLTKIILANVGFFDPNSALIPTFHVIHNYTLGIAGIFWLGMFLPNKFLMWVSSPLIFINKVIAYRRIKTIPQYFQHVQPDLSPIAVVNEPVSIWDFLTNLNFYLYRTIIHVLDIKRHLKGDFEGEDHPKWNKVTHENIEEWF